jgi:hypothetical protein
MAGRGLGPAGPEQAGAAGLGRRLAPSRAAGSLQPGGRCRVGEPGAPPGEGGEGGGRIFTPFFKRRPGPCLLELSARSFRAGLWFSAGPASGASAGPPGWTLVNPANVLLAGPIARNRRRRRRVQAAPLARARTPWPARSWRRELRTRLLRRWNAPECAARDSRAGKLPDEWVAP